MLRRARQRPRLLSDERGLALIMAIGMTTVLGVAGTSAVYYATQNSSATIVSVDATMAYSTAEAGLNDARSVLWNAADPTSQASVPGLSATEPATPQYIGAGTKEYYWGTYDSSAKIWTLYGKGVVPDHEAPASAISRLLSTKVQVTPAGTQQDLRSWSGLYANSATCTTFSNGVTITAPLYTRGGLCMTGNAKITAPSVQVEGNLSLANSATIGAPGAPIQTLSVAGSTTLSGSAAIYATNTNSTPSGVSKPTLSVSNWYQNADLGPKSGCTVGSLPPGVSFDNNATQDWGAPTVDLTPGGKPYSCVKKDAQGNVVAQLIWNGAWTSGGTLQVKGTIFFDSPVVMNNAVTVYTGIATIYAASFAISNGAGLCGISGCTSSWDPSTNLIVLVAGKPGITGFSLSGAGISQVAVYCAGDASIGNGATNYGPIIAEKITISGGADLPVAINTLPASAPVNTTTTAPSVQNIPNTFSG